MGAGAVRRVDDPGALGREHDGEGCTREAGRRRTGAILRIPTDPDRLGIDGSIARERAPVAQARDSRATVTFCAHPRRGS
jgi:hypothetical protein